MSNDDTRPHNLPLGIALIVAATFTISLQDVIFKFFSSELTLWQIFALRALITFPLFFSLALFRGNAGSVFADAFRPWPLLRGLFMTFTFMAFYAAIPFLSLSTIGAANYTAPIFITLLSAYAISEPVGFRGWIAVLVGFAGVLILLQPGTDAFSFWALLPVIGACFYALAHIITRSRCQPFTATSMAVSVNFMMLMAGLSMSGLLLVWHPGNELADAYPYLLGGWSSIGKSEWLILGVLAVFVVAVSILLAGAYKVAPPSTVGTFEYSYLVFVAIWDFLFFNTALSLPGIIGMAMIVGAGLLVMRRS